MLNIINAPEGMVYCGKESGIICKTLILGVTDSISNYELIPEPIEKPKEKEEVENYGESDIPV